MANASRDETFDRLADEGKLIAYFGYGSLVNPFTHRTEIITYTPAFLHGWSRRWRARPDPRGDPIAFLSSSPVTGANGATPSLAGLLVFDHVDSLPALDVRENDYHRRTLSRSDLDCGIDVPDGCPIYVYEGRPARRKDIRHAVLQSYLDAVLQGYHLIYGEDGVDDFMQQTDCFDLPVLADRARPRYPRHVSLDPMQKLAIDRATAGLEFIDSVP